MKITVWIRATQDGRDKTIRVDDRYESYDTPMVHAYGRRLVDAIMSCTKDAKKEDGND